MAGPEAAKNSVDNNGGKTGWESVAAQEFRGETNINSKTGDSRTFTLRIIIHGWRERLRASGRNVWTKFSLR